MNAGWWDIALKIEGFIRSPKRLVGMDPSTFTEANYPYVSAVSNSNWQSRDLREAIVNNKDEYIEVKTQPDSQEEGSLRRCLVGYLERRRTKKNHGLRNYSVVHNDMEESVWC